MQFVYNWHPQQYDWDIECGKESTDFWKVLVRKEELSLYVCFINSSLISNMSCTEIINKLYKLGPELHRTWLRNYLLYCNWKCRHVHSHARTLAHRNTLLQLHSHACTHVHSRKDIHANFRTRTVAIHAIAPNCTHTYTYISHACTFPHSHINMHLPSHACILTYAYLRMNALSYACTLVH